MNDKKGKEFIVVSIYNSGDWEKIERAIKKVIIENDKDMNIMIGGDFNIRIGEGRGQEPEVGDRSRNSKDKKAGTSSRKMLNLIDEIGGIF